MGDLAVNRYVLGRGSPMVDKVIDLASSVTFQISLLADFSHKVAFFPCFHIP